MQSSPTLLQGQLLLACGEQSVNPFSRSVRSLISQGLIPSPKAGYCETLSTIRLSTRLGRELAPCIFLSLESSVIKVFAQAESDTGFYEITSIRTMLTIITRLLFESEAFRQWALLMLGSEFSRNRFYSEYDIEIASHLIMHGFNTLSIQENFFWTTLLSRVQFDNQGNLSIDTFHTALKRDAPQDIFSMPILIGKKHQKIIKKIYISLRANNSPVSPCEVFAYVFSGSESNTNRKHLTRLSHTKTISIGMMQAFMVLLGRLQVAEIARLKCVYDVTASPGMASSILFLLDKGYNLDSLSNKSADEIRKDENDYHQFVLSSKWQRAPGATFPEPFKPGIPGLIEYLPCQKELDTEGEQMQHCVASYGTACHNGEISIYRVFGKQRCTLAVDNRTGEVMELYGYRNEAPQASTLTMVEDWLGMHIPCASNPP